VARTCYLVLRQGDKWIMQVNDRTWDFDAEADALAAARAAAQSVWEKSGLRSLVRIQQPDGQWLEESRHGETPLPPSRPKK
jgi:hypothetical protein